MMGRTHALGGLASLCLLNLVPGTLSTVPDAGNIGVLAVCAVFGALFPDLDAPRSLLSVLSYNKKGIAPFALPAQVLSRSLGHRRTLHSFVGFAASTLLVGWPLWFYLGWLSVLAFALGFLSHLMLDCMTPTGLPLLWPTRRSIWILPRKMRIVTGSPPEDAVFVLLALAALSLFLLLIPRSA